MGEIFKISHKLLDSLPTSIVFTDLHSRVLYVNPQAESFFGYRRDEIIGERLRLLFFEEDLLFLYPNIIYLTLYRHGFDGEVLLRQKDGRKIFVRLYTTSFKEQGEIFLAFAFHEIQRQKDLEHEKLEVNRWASLGRMIEEIAHQFRNPISAIGGYTQRLLKGSPARSKEKTYLNRIWKESNRLETILKRLEEYVQLPAPTFRSEALEEIAQEAISRFLPEVTAKGVGIRLDTKSLSGDGRLFMDRDLILKALQQVLANSLEAVLRQPKRNRKEAIEVALRDDGDIIQISIRDRGAGIPKKHLEFVFDPFFSTYPQRVGLGLTLVRKVMEEHGGRASIESRAKRGTTLNLFFSKDRRRKLRRESILPESIQKDGFVLGKSDE